MENKTVEEFLETKQLKLKDAFEGYVIPYAYLKELLEEYASQKLTEKDKEIERLQELLIGVYFKTKDIPQDLKSKIEKEIDFNEPLTEKIVC